MSVANTNPPNSGRPGSSNPPSGSDPPSVASSDAPGSCAEAPVVEPSRSGAKIAADASAAYRAQKISAAVGVIAAMLIALFVNMLSARHYERWDLTSSGRYTLNDKTVQILQSLSAPVEVYVLLSAAEPSALTVRHLLQAYQAQTNRIDVQFVDPDRNPAHLRALQQRYDMVAGRTADGQLVADAAIIVARGQRHHFITAAELVDVDRHHEQITVRSRVEQALTAAIMRVLRSGRPPVCFTSGHGEASVDDFTARGLGLLKRRLINTNYEVVVLPPLVAVDGRDPIDSCKLVIVAGPQQRLSRQEDTRLRVYLERGGNALLTLGPIFDSVGQRMIDPGLDSVLGLANIIRQADVVFERAASRRTSQGFGESLFAKAKSHAITSGMIETGDRDFGVYLEMASSLASKSGERVPTPLLETSAEAFGMVDFFTWAKDPVPPQPVAGDHRGPLVLAYAVELPVSASSATKGGRLVVVSSDGVLSNANWYVEQAHTALFVENAISWLAAEPIDLQLPQKPAQAAGLRITEDSLSSVARYALLYVPLAAVLLGLAVAIRRRASGRTK